MTLGRVIGTVVASHKVASLVGQRLLIVQPESEAGAPLGEPVIAVDVVSAAPGQRVYFVRSREAAKALPDTFNPADAAILGIVDRVSP
ncbi:MAG: EutN/CcmL family microcompartment protein [bacterium]